MRSIIVGTAGHIDHGKTALVKALTGIDADRLQEEKRRGITIDLGFAHMDLPVDTASVRAASVHAATVGAATVGAAKSGETLRIGFVDVPGHERFVRNMLAGVGGIDLVLLVIAADESIKPQTREHFDILQLLGVQRGITVLTKSDAVDAETLEVVRMEVQDFLRGTFLETPKSPVVAVSALTGAGLEDLKRAMVAVAANLPARDSKALARLPIDRVFTMRGFGTVVTGTLLTGTIRPEDELEVFPTRRRVRVRGVQVHGQVADAAVAGQRTALNIAGASTEDLARGMTLTSPETLRITRVVDVKLQLLASAPRGLKDRARVHFHSYTMESVGEVAFYGPAATAKTPEPSAAKLPAAAAVTMTKTITMAMTKSGSGIGRSGVAERLRPQLQPGAEGLARITLPEPALLLPGDRFIIRQFSPVVTIGGGVVLDAAPMIDPRGARKLERAAGGQISARSALMELFESGRRGAILTGRVSRRGKRGLTLAEAVAETGWPRTDILELANVLVREKLLVRFQDRLFAEPEFASAQASVLDAVSRTQRANPLSPGVAKVQMQEELQRALELAPELFDAAVAALAAAKKLELVNELVRLPGQGVVMKDEELESKKRIEEAVASAGLKVPALHEVLAGLKIDKARAQKIVTLLLRDRVLIKISDELVFHRSALEQLRRDLAVYKTKSPKIDVAKFKELTGVSRKYAIPLLEYLDRERVTRRVGDAREIL